MGASGWSYFVPYQADIQRALDDLRQDVFRRGEFLQIHPWWREIDFADFLPPETLDAQELGEYRAEFDRLQALPLPTTIQEWIDWNGTEGTHSILDVDRVVAGLPPKPDWTTYAIDPAPVLAASAARFSAVSPLTPAELQQIFQTTTPSHDLVVARARTLGPLRDRNEGLYIVVYDTDYPREIYFAGFSGD